MPTVGCEADAVAFTEQATSTAPSGTAGAGGGGPANAGLAYLPDGSYSSGPVSFDSGPDGASKLRFEACFAADGLSAEGALKRDSDGGAAPRWVRSGFLVPRHPYFLVILYNQHQMV